MTNEGVLLQFQPQIGTRYAPAVKAYITRLTGRSYIVGPDEVSTKELDPNRIHIRVGEGDLITALRFG